MLDLKKSLDKIFQNMGTRIVKIYNVSSLPAGIADSTINSKYVLTNIGLSNPAAQTSDWTIETEDYVDANTNNITVSGSISGTTDITLYLCPGKNEINTSSGTVNLDLATIDPSVITLYESLGWTQPTT